MSMPTVNEYWENATKANNVPQIEVKLAIVEALTPDNRPVIRFAGESAPSQKIYVHMKHYIPTIGDMVMLINGVIQGGWTSVK